MYPTQQDTYREMRSRSKSRGDYALSEEEAAQRTLRYVASKAARGAFLSVGYVCCKKTGNLVLTIALVVGTQVIATPAMMYLSAAMGAVTALRFVVDASRLYTASKSCIGYDAEAAKTFENVQH